MYLSYFQFTEWPFSTTPDPRFVYLSPRHEEAFAHLLYGVKEHGGFVQITGEVGKGKTTICRYFLDRIPANVDVALVLNPMLTPEELLATVCEELGVPHPAEAPSRKVYVDALYGHLLTAHQQGRRTVLIVDEAQDVSAESLEQLRLLTNLETEKQKLLQIVLIGQPELITLLARKDLRQLAQRITARYHLLPFNEADTCAYILHRLRVAGCAAKLFSDPAMRQVHRAARGIPRLINVVCDRALLGAYAQGQARVNVATIRRAAREALGPQAGFRIWWRSAAVAAGVLLLAGAAAYVWGLSPRRLLPMGASAPQAAPVAPDPPAGALAATREPVRGATPLAKPRLAAVLADATLTADKASAFRRLLARWHVVVPESETRPCTVATRTGFECVEMRGTWMVIRRLDLPAVIKLVGGEGKRNYAAVTAIGSETATLEFGDRVVTVPVSDVESRWDGTFAFVWKPPPFVKRVLSPGMRGPDVEWLRRRLDALDGAQAAAKSDLYDDELRARVQAFQQKELLEADGIAGVETLARIGARLEREAPLLSSAR